MALDIQMKQLVLHQSAITFKMMETLNRRHSFHAGRRRNYCTALWGGWRVQPSTKTLKICCLFTDCNYIFQLNIYSPWLKKGCKGSTGRKKNQRHEFWELGNWEPASLYFCKASFNIKAILLHIKEKRHLDFKLLLNKTNASSHLSSEELIDQF